MGLDIYLYKYQDFEKTKKAEDQYSEFSEKLWDGKEYDSLSKEEKDSLFQEEKEFATNLGLDESGEDVTGKKRIEFPHQDYPDHYFRIGYFKSSYNSGGIERILHTLGLPTLHDVFQQEGEYVFRPNWQASLDRINELIKSFKEKGPYRVHQVSANIFSQPEIKSAKQALDAFITELDRENKLKSNYSNKTGEFYMTDPIKVLAMIPGKSTLFEERDCIYVVTESDNTWYEQALEIVKATCEHVLSQEDMEKYYLRWSS
jgi:hypothetical protein